MRGTSSLNYMSALERDSADRSTRARGSCRIVIRQDEAIATSDARVEECLVGIAAAVTFEDIGFDALSHLSMGWKLPNTVIPESFPASGARSAAVATPLAAGATPTPSAREHEVAFVHRARPADRSPSQRIRACRPLCNGASKAQWQLSSEGRPRPQQHRRLGRTVDRASPAWLPDTNPQRSGGNHQRIDPRTSRARFAVRLPTAAEARLQGIANAL